ncbi:hypothetical protein ACHAW5_005372 [Stephanodiscus triporus]|uniref:DNA-directed DNA polymerase family A palm domain-containing protein n=1 Tax=Stephanodiscus triporus TaxID=2934178 RepID=A0ABD3Q563_9STRA
MGWFRAPIFSMRYGLGVEDGGGKGNNSQNQNDHPNLKSEDGRIDSKAAQFFHPRPVMALMPYKDFFSPLTFPSDGPDVAECKTSLDDKYLSGSNYDMGGVRGTKNNQSQHVAFCMQASHDYAQQQPQHQTPPEPSVTNAAQILEPSREASHNEPTSNLKPRQLDNIYDNIRAELSNDHFKKPPKQSKLVRDSETGKMGASLEASIGEKRKAKSWDDYGGRPVDDTCNKANQLFENAKAKKTKKKDATKKRKDKPVDFFNEDTERPVIDLRMGGEAKKGKHKVEKEKSKKQKRDHRSLHVAELQIPAYESDDAEKDIDDGDAPKISESDFVGIEQMELKNAAQCLEGLQEFLTLVGRQKHVAFTALFLDPYTGNYFTSTAAGQSGEEQMKKKKAARTNKFTQHSASPGFECTTPFLPTSKKYCTPKGHVCTAWNCTCDSQIRGMRASATLLGAMFVFENKDAGRKSDGDGNAGSDHDWQYFILPLGPTVNTSTDHHEVEYARMSSWPIIPFHCDVSLSDRWLAFEALLFNERTKLVTYNATLSLLPFYHHLDNDVASETQSSNLTSFSAYVAGVNPSQSHPCRNDGYLRSIWDLRLVSWMLRPHAKDDELEFTMFKDGFGHLAPGHQPAPKSDMSILMQGLREAKSNLELIYSLYPIMNVQIVNGGLLDALECIETPVQSILASMESRGIGFFPHRLKRIENQIESRIGELETQSRLITNDPSFLLSSPIQVSNFLFDVLSLQIPAGIISKTTAGSTHRSTSEEALHAIKDEMAKRTGTSPPIIDMILEFRQLNKLLTTFVRPLPNICRRSVTTHSGTTKRSKREGFRIFPQWMQTSVRTGRLSCRKPNLQQVPKEGAFGVIPRDAFATEDGRCLLACDYSQKEVRILAHMSRDEAMIALFRGNPNVDIYRQMSSIVLNKPADAVTDKERSQFKIITLAILYGMSANQVATKLTISKANAQQLMTDFFRRFRRIKPWMDETKDYARRKLYVKTISGRKRYLDDINSDDNAKRSQAERQAINTVIQGSAADMMKTAMIHLATNLMRWQDDATRPRMLLQIHDELILEVRFNEQDIKKLKDIAQKSCCFDCEKLFQLKVPMLLNVSVGRSWGAMTAI